MRQTMTPAPTPTVPATTSSSIVRHSVERCWLHAVAAQIQLCDGVDDHEQDRRGRSSPDPNRHRGRDASRLRQVYASFERGSSTVSELTPPIRREYAAGDPAACATPPRLARRPSTLAPGAQRSSCPQAPGPSRVSPTNSPAGRLSSAASTGIAMFDSLSTSASTDSPVAPTFPRSAAGPTPPCS